MTERLVELKVRFLTILIVYEAMLNINLITDHYKQELDDG
jgi:hypothetical protein